MARTRDEDDYAAQRARILSVGAKLFRHRGYAATTTEDLATELGVSRAAVYYYYKKKHDILLDICKRAVDSLLVRVRSIDPGRPVEARLETFVHDFLEVFTESLEAWSVFFQEPSLQQHPIGQQIVAVELEIAAVLERLIAEGMRTGAFSAGNPRIVTLGILGMCAWIHRWYRAEGHGFREISAEFMQLIRSGLVPAANGRENREHERRNAD